MDFYEVLDQVIDLLKQRGRASYSGLKVQFDLDDKALEALKDELVEVHQFATDHEGKMLLWSGETEGTPVSVTQPDQPDSAEQEEPSVQVKPPLTEPYTPDAERRQLTILFTDLVDSTKLSGQLDAEEYREIVRAYQASCAEVIERFDCHLAQTLGDGLLIYSGYPVAHENDAERAVRVGLGILDAMKELNASLKTDKDIRLAVRVGIHTGQVVIGEVGTGARPEQLALGEVPNIAARIQGLAEPDTMVISEATYRLIQGYFECQEQGAQSLRGVAEPMPVYQVLSESGVQSRLDIASARSPTPLVGRSQEVGLLIDRWEQAKDGQGQVLLLSGEAGIGKSRLVQALKNHVSADVSHVRLECRSSPFFTNSALYPIIDMIQRTLRFQADDTPEQKLAKLEQNLSQYRLPTDETVPLLASLLSLPVPEDRYPPLNLTPQRQRQKTLESIVAIVLELAEQQPVLFIQEDGHWLDASTNELLDLLIDQTPTAPILILITYRPEFQPQWGNRSYLTQLTLNRLARNQIEQIATQVAGGKTLSSEVIEQLVEKTDGVPLYVEEMTKAVLESGVLKDVDDQYELTGAVSTLAIPATLQDSLMARLDRLVTAKAVAQYAAVIGRQFSYELLQAVSELDEETLQRELGRLVEAELVYQRGLPPQATYLFKHSLVADTAYQSLLRSTRQGYHRRIAEVLAEQFLETTEHQPELLAYHYTEAGLNEQAIAYWQRAGEGAIQRSANVEAIAHLNHGLELLAALPDTAVGLSRELDIQLSLGVALTATTGYASPEVERAYTRAHALCQQTGETPQRLLVLERLRSFYFVRGKLQIARELAAECISIAENQHDKMCLVQAHSGMGVTLLTLGEVSAARTHHIRSIDSLDTQLRPFLYSGALPGVSGLATFAYGALVLWLLGYSEKARQWGREALSRAQDMSHPYSLAFAQTRVAMLHHCLRDVHAMHQHAEKAKTLSIEHGFRYLLVNVGMLQGWVSTVLGQVEAGTMQMHQGLSDYRGTGSEVFRTYFLTLLADGYDKMNEVGAGLNMLADAMVAVDETDEHWWESEIHRLKGELLLQQFPDNHIEAETCFHQALEVSRHQQAKSLELRAVTSLARLWQSQGKRDEGWQLLEPVYSWFTEGFDTADLKDAKRLLDEIA